MTADVHVLTLALVSVEIELDACARLGGADRRRRLTLAYEHLQACRPPVPFDPEPLSVYEPQVACYLQIEQRLDLIARYELVRTWNRLYSRVFQLGSVSSCA